MEEPRYRVGRDGVWRPESKAASDWRNLGRLDRMAIVVFVIYTLLWGLGHTDQSHIIDVIHAGMWIGGIWLVLRALF